MTFISIKAPSNIALVKYWGKKGRQHPLNPSISMTLDKCATTCAIEYQKSDSGFRLSDYRFAGKENKKFQNRIETYLRDIIDVCPILNTLNLSIETENSFPHSAGIASSASAFAAIGYALANIENQLGYDAGVDLEKRASFLARLGSGSAARSITGPYTLWGDYNKEGHDDYAVPIENIHHSFNSVKNSILLIDQSEKPISSSLGHSLMQNHPFGQARIDQANQNTTDIIEAMRGGDWQKFGDIVEAEALTLHALMMTSSPSYILLAPNSIEAINRIRDFRADTNLSIYFTIDAGPNIHVIYPDEHKDKTRDFIDHNLTQLCQDNAVIHDECEKGARVLS
jgi:diphosphomevalonate decarboxylase